MKKFALVGFVVISVFAVSMYLYLGGTSELSYQMTSEEFYFMGTTYSGSVENKKPQLLFENARDIALNKEGVFVAVINYNTSKEDSINQVIGVVAQRPLPEDIITADTSINFSKPFIKTLISSHSVVMPNPEEVKNGAVTFAEEKGSSLEDWSLELYRGERNLEVYFPVKN